MPPGLASPYHVHHREDEAFYVLEGTIAFLCGDSWRIAGPGTWVYGPRDIPHASASPALTAAMCRARSWSTAAASVSLAAIPDPFGISGKGPRMSTPYFAAVAASNAMSGGDGATSIGALSSRTNPSNPAGAHCSSMRAGLVPMTRNRFTKLFAGVSVRDFVIQSADAQTYGDALIEHGTWKATFHPTHSSQALPCCGTFMTLYARTSDGSVRVMKDIFNGLPL